MKIIGVIQVKGGAGRSTVSTNLAGALSKLVNTEIRASRELVDGSRIASRGYLG